MAISTLHPLRGDGSLLAAINYITNPDKTDSELYVYSYACNTHMADLEFAETASLGHKRGSIKAQHLIQAFAPGEVTPELAHEIGRKLAIEVTEGKFEFVIATHVDKNHIHNHIIFNQVSFIDHKKYRGNIYCQRQIAEINDTLCASYGLSVIKRGDEKAKPYYEYNGLKTKNSNRQVLKNTIDSCIPLVENFDEMLQMLSKIGYEIKVSNDNYSLKKEGTERFIRLKNLGENYTHDAIVTRIKYKNIDAKPYFAPPKTKVGLLPDLSDKLDQIKNPAYQNKVALSQVTRIAATYAFLNEHEITSVSMIKEKQSEWALSIKEKRASIKTMEDDISRLEKVVEALERREKYNDVYATYLKSGKNKDFKEKHESEILLFESACKILSLQKVSPDTKSIDIKTQLNEIIEKKNALLESYRNDVSDLKQLNISAKNVELIMAENEKNNVRKRGKEKDI